MTVPQRFVEAASRFDGEPAQSYARRAGPVRSLAGRAFPRPAEGERATLTYGQLGGIVADLAAGFRRLADEGDRVAVRLGTRAEWPQVDLALQAAGLATVTVPPAATSDETARALAEQDVAGAVLPSEDALDGMGDVLDGGFAVLADGTGHAEGVTTHALASVRQDGAEAFDPSSYERWVFDRSPDETATVVYDWDTGRPPSATPGEDDDPLRGRAFSHAALAAAVETAVTGGTGRPDPSATPGPSVRRPEPEDTVLVSRSPTARYARVAGHLTPLTVGATVAYPATDEPLVDDLRALRPDLVYAAAADCTAMVETLRERADRGLTSGLVGWALDRQTDSEDVLDRLALRRLRRTFGGVGPIVLPTAEPGGDTDAVATLARAGITVERYRPLPGTAMLLPPGADGEHDEAATGLAPVPDALPGLETRRTATDERAAELLVRGSAVFDGFPAEPGVTLGAFERGNWFRTGLVGPTDALPDREDDTGDRADGAGQRGDDPPDRGGDPPQRGDGPTEQEDGPTEREDGPGDRDSVPTGVPENQGAAD